MKFGGTSVDGPERLASVARIVGERRAEEPVVVTSAMAGVTNELAALLETARTGEREALEHRMEELARRHRLTAAAVAGADQGLLDRLDQHLRDLRVLLRGVRLLGTASERASDQVLGFGELLAQELLVAALQRGGDPAEMVDARGVVITDDRFGAARPDPIETRRRCQDGVVPLVRKGLIPVLGGYLGATAEGIPTTLGRGGSDLSAAVIGVALEAAKVEIWTDVDGLMTADPGRVSSARLLDRVTFREAAELAGFGARVLHPAAIDPAIQSGIPVLIKNSLHPRRPGTWIGPAASGPCPVRAVAAREGLTLYGVRAPGWKNRPGFLPHILEDLEKVGLVPVAVFPGAVWVEFLLASQPPAAALLAAAGTVETAPGLALVAVVGEALADHPGGWAEVLAQAAAHGPLRVCLGPRGSSLMLVVPERESAALMKLLHQRLIEERVPPFCG